MRELTFLGDLFFKFPEHCVLLLIHRSLLYDPFGIVLQIFAEAICLLTLSHKDTTALSHPSRNSSISLQHKILSCRLIGFSSALTGAVLWCQMHTCSADWSRVCVCARVCVCVLAPAQ